MRTTVPPSAPAGATPADLLDIHAVARRLTVSERTVRRLVARGAMPAPVRLGALIRWRRADLDRWIEEGCPASRGRRTDSPVAGGIEE
jgi:excisionase family DNA binding protein